MSTEFKAGDLVRCRDCGALWWGAEAPVKAFVEGWCWTLRTPYPCGPCCDNQKGTMDLVCHDYDGHLFAAPDGVEWLTKAPDLRGLAERAGMSETQETPHWLTLLGALQDRPYPASGKLIRAVPIKSFKRKS